MSATSTQAPTPTPQQYVEIEVQKIKSPEDIVKEKAIKYNVSVELLQYIITKESQWNRYIQSKHRYPRDIPKVNIKKGTRERSFGPVQINLDWNPHISYEQATDWDFAVDFLAKNISQGKGHLWSTYPKSL